MKKLCFICDANSIHAKNLISYFQSNFDIYIISTTSVTKSSYPGLEVEGKIKFLSGEFEELSSSEGFGWLQKVPLWFALLLQNFRHVLLKVKCMVFPILYKGKVNRLIKKINPDIVHILRLPYEGYIASSIKGPKIVVTLWGNDLVYWPRINFIIKYYTKKILNKTDLLLPDTCRDKYLADLYGLRSGVPVWSTPAQGGLLVKKELAEIKNQSKEEMKASLGLAGKKVIVANRGFNSWYIKTDELIAAIAELVKKDQNYHFFIEGNTHSVGFKKCLQQVKQYGISEYVTLEKHSRTDFLKLLRCADVITSMAIYDGLSVSLLESLYLEAFPILLFQRSYDNWLVNNKNCIFSENTSDGLAQSITRYFEEFQSKSVSINKSNAILLEEKANYANNLDRLSELYTSL